MATVTERDRRRSVFIAEVPPCRVRAPESSVGCAAKRVQITQLWALGSGIPDIGSGLGIVPIDRPRPGVVGANSPNRATGA
jgi:hypothetical protein